MKKWFVNRETDRFIFGHLVFVLMGVVLLIVLLGGLIFSMVEHWTYFESIYFVVMTITTIGYGDYVPATHIGKVFTMVYSFVGVPIFVSIMGIIFEARLKNSIKSHIDVLQKELSETEKEIEETKEQVIKQKTAISNIKKQQAKEINTKKEVESKGWIMRIFKRG